jgi:hypothetical protein
MFSVWVGGVQVNDFYLTRKEAYKLGNYYLKLGYVDVQLEKENN